MNPAADPSVILSLREATADRHRRLEAILRLDEALERGNYIRVLSGFESFLSAWEPHVRRAMPARLHDWFASRSRYRLLCDDLSQLGSRPALDSVNAATCASLVDEIELHGTAAVFGSMYVLEGSALGGQVILKTAGEQLGIGPHNGAAYFNGFGPETGRRWHDFRSMLEAEVGLAPADRHAARTAAEQTFDALIGTFTLVCGRRATGAAGLPLPLPSH